MRICCADSLVHIVAGNKTPENAVSRFIVNRPELHVYPVLNVRDFLENIRTRKILYIVISVCSLVRSLLQQVRQFQRKTPVLPAIRANIYNMASDSAER